MMTSGLGSFLAFSLLAPLLVVGLIALAMTVVAGGKEPDATGMRVRAVYLGSACFVSLFLMLGAGYAAVSSLTELIGESDELSGSTSVSRSVGADDQGGFEITTGPQADEETRTEDAVSGAVMAVLVGAAAAVVFQFHRRRMEDLIAEPGFVGTPARRSVQAYHYAVAFLAAFIGLAAAASAAYALYRIALPDYSNPLGDNERTGGARQLISTTALAAASVLVFLRHLERPHEWERDAAASTAIGPAATGPMQPGTAPSDPDPIDLEPEPPQPRRRRTTGGAGSDNEGGPIA